MKPGDIVGDTQGARGTVIRVEEPPRKKGDSRPSVKQEVYVLWHVNWKAAR